MSRLVDRPLPLVADAKGNPLRFFWQGRWHQVRVIFDSWREVGAWWEGEPEKTFYRVEADSGLYELYSDGTSWGLYKILD